MGQGGRGGLKTLKPETCFAIRNSWLHNWWTHSRWNL